MAPEAVDLNRIIAGMGGLLQSAVGATNRIEAALSDPLSLGARRSEPDRTCHLEPGYQCPGRDALRWNDHDQNLERQARCACAARGAIAR